VGFGWCVFRGRKGVFPGDVRPFARAIDRNPGSALP
jgi:hypothetical protein